MILTHPKNEPFRFTHLLFLAQTYHLTAEEAAELESTSPRSKKPKNDTVPTSGGIFSVHPEDEYIQKVGTSLSFLIVSLISPSQFALHALDFSYSTAQPRDKESFGLDVACRMMLLPAENLASLVDALTEAFPPPQ